MTQAKTQAGVEAQPLWEVRGLSKSFPGVLALDRVSVAIWPGEIHGLVGGNGSGKSTLIKCLSGAHQPDEGIICHRGQAVTVANPHVARSFGVATIYQEFSLVPTLTVAENLFLGRWPNRRRSIDWRAMRSGAKKILESLGIDLDPDTLVGRLSVAEQQLVEIAKSVSTDATLVIMDEPTTALGLAETERLHQLMRTLVRQGRAVLYISHRLDDVLEVAHRITVLKDGRVVTSRPSQGLTLREVVRLMVGSDIEEYFPKKFHATDRPLLVVRGLRTERIADATFTVHEGEVVGLAGVRGSGRTAIARAIFGLEPMVSGTIELKGRPLTLRSPRDAIAAGIAYVTENRKTDGLFFNFHASPNITIADLRALLRGSLLSLRREEAMAQDLGRKLRIDARAFDRSVRLLSGGNQQKVILARWLFSQAQLFILDEPTQGIDVEAKLEVYRIMNELTAAGKSVLLISSEFPELLAMSDRVAIVKRGRVERVLPSRDLDRMTLTEMVAESQRQAAE